MRSSGIPGVGLGRRGRCDLDTGAVPEGELRDGVVDGPPGLPVAGHEEDARPVAGADEDVLGPVRAVEEIPRTERPLLTLDQQEALAMQDEEALLCLLPVVEPVGLSGLEDAEPHAEVGELRVGRLEHAARAEDVVREPRRVARVDDEPAVGRRRQPGSVVRQPRFGVHSHANPNRGSGSWMWARGPSAE